MIVSIMAVLFGVAGIGLLYASWRGVGRKSIAIPLGWVALLLSVLFWVNGAGLEFGVPYALLFFSVIAWMAIGLNYEIRRINKSQDKPYVPQTLPRSRSILQHVMIFFVAVPMTGVAAAFLSVVLSKGLPFTQVSALATAVLVMPVLWGVGSYWVCAANKLWQPTATIALLSLLCAGIIYG